MPSPGTPRVRPDDVLRQPVDRRTFIEWSARTTLAGFTMLGAWGAAGCSGSERAPSGTPGTTDLPGEITVGVIAPMDGIGQFVGDVVDRGLRAAHEHIVAERLFPGTRVRYRIVNARAEELAQATARAYAQLVSDPTVVGILWCTAIGLGEARVQIRRDRIPVIAVFQDLWSEDLLWPNAPERSVFQYVQPDRLAFDVLMEYAKRDRGYRRAALLYDSTLGDLPQRNFERALASQGVEPAGIEEFKLFTGDFGAQLQRLKRQRGDCLFVWGVAESAAKIVQELDALGAAYIDTPTARDGAGWHPQLFGWAAGLGEKRWVELAGDAGRVGTLTTWNLGGLVAQPAFPIRDWTRRYLDRMPTGGEEAPANCYWALLQAVKQAGSTDRAAVVRALEQLRTTFAGLEFGFGERHLAVGRDEIVTITLERSSGPAATDPPYALGREFAEVWQPAYGEYAGPTHLVRPTLEANRRAFPDAVERILTEGWGTICTVRPANRRGAGLRLTNECKIH